MSRALVPVDLDLTALPDECELSRPVAEAIALAASVVLRSPLVFRSLQVVDVAIHLDHEPSSKAVAVDDPPTDHMLRTHSRPKSLAA